MCLSISLEAIEGVIGVSSPNVHGGLTTEEITEICYISGKYSNKLVAIDVTDYNPFKEDWRSGRLLATMFYYFTLGYSMRLSQQK